MADTPVPDADPTDVEEQQRPVVADDDAGAPDVPPVPDADPADMDQQRQPASATVPRTGAADPGLEADPADAHDQSVVVDDEDDDRR